jgi:hypothetical protein
MAHKLRLLGGLLLCCTLNLLAGLLLQVVLLLLLLGRLLQVVLLACICSSTLTQHAIRTSHKLGVLLFLSALGICCGLVMLLLCLQVCLKILLLLLLAARLVS